jgi:hypothetical protein
MVTNMLYGSPLRDTRRLQDEVNRLFQSAATPRTSFPAINVYAGEGLGLLEIGVGMHPA